jgi:hypothetical protein
LVHFDHRAADSCQQQRFRGAALDADRAAGARRFLLLAAGIERLYH